LDLKKEVQKIQVGETLKKKGGFLIYALNSAQLGPAGGFSFDIFGRLSWQF